MPRDNNQAKSAKVPTTISPDQYFTWLRRDLEYLLGAADAYQNPSIRSKVQGMISTTNKFLNQSDEE